MKQMLIVIALVVGAAAVTFFIIAGDENKGLTIIDLKVGTGKEAEKGDVVMVEYVGKLADGTKFDASADHPESR